jgi:hypothetical protein
MVPVARKRVFPKGEGNGRCWYRSTPLRHRQNRTMALLQRVIDVDKAFLPVARFRGATGQIWASGAILKAYRGLQTYAHRAIPV